MRQATELTVCVAAVALAYVGANLTSHSVAQSQGGAAVSSSTDPAAREITAVGCLMQTDTSGWRPATSRSKTPLNLSSGFVLKDASTEPNSARDAGAPGFREFGLFSSRNFKLDEHVGQQVEVKGRLIMDPESARSRRGSDSKEADETAPSPEPLLNPGRTVLEMSTVRVISADCPQR